MVNSSRNWCINSPNIQFSLAYSYLICTLGNVGADMGPLLGIERTAPLKVATHSPFVFKSGATVSHIFFFGLSTASGRLTYPSTSTKSPGTAPLGGNRISTWFNGYFSRINIRNFYERVGTFSGVDAHINIPSEVIPLILAGLRLHINMAIRSCISSMGTCLTKPLTIVLVFPSPTSTSSTYKESASGCFFTKVKD